MPDLYGYSARPDIRPSQRSIIYRYADRSSRLGHFRLSSARYIPRSCRVRRAARTGLCREPKPIAGRLRARDTGWAIRRPAQNARSLSGRTCLRGRLVAGRAIAAPVAALGIVQAFYAGGHLEMSAQRAWIPAFSRPANMAQPSDFLSSRVLSIHARRVDPRPANESRRGVAIAGRSWKLNGVVIGQTRNPHIS